MSRTIQHENSVQASSRRNREDMGMGEHNTAGAAVVEPTSGGDCRGPMTVLLTGVLIAAISFAACRKSHEQELELEAIDVAPALVIETDGDPVAIERPAALVGVLPEDFPADLPIYLPASLVDFGAAEDGWMSVSLLSPHSPARVERELSALIAERGWTVTASGSFRLLRKGSIRVRLRVEDARPGTQYRFEYPG